jgi:hypothetical protein
MSHQQSQEDNQPERQQPEELQQPNRQAVLPPQAMPAICQVIGVLAHIAYEIMIDRIAAQYKRIPYHTSILSGEGWVHELLAGHPERMRKELGVYRSTFIVLVKALQSVGLRSSRHVSIEEQLSIFLYIVVTALPCTHVGERFQRSTDTITK